jgi:hypothetical protein
MKLLSSTSAYFFIAVVSFGAQSTEAQGGSNEVASVAISEQEGQVDPQRAGYESWIRDYRKEALGGALGDNHEIKFGVTVVEGDDLPIEPKTASVLGPLYRVVHYGYAVSTEGTVSYFYVSSLGVKGGGPSELPAEDFEKLSRLIEELPDDGSKLPPPGRRVVVQVASGGGLLARVYDRANLPQSVLEVLRLSHSQIRPITLTFPAEKNWALSDFSQTGIPADAIRLRGPDVEETTILAISPGNSFFIRQVQHDTAAVVVTDSDPAHVIHTMREAQTEGRRSIGIYHAEFAPDGRYLLLLSTLPAVRIYDTLSWERVVTLPELPPSAVSYFASSDWRSGVFANASGEVALWDAQSRREIAKLDTDGKLSAVSFSPDDSMFATTSGHENKDMSSTFHLRIWNSTTGEMIHELRPFEESARDDIGDPIWSPDGKYLMATVRDNPMGSNHDIGIWSLRSGRFRGQFSGCVYSSDPLSVVLHHNKLFERCRDGMIFMWDAAGAFGKIAEFENNLTEASANN